ncbi:hypothetical protein BDR26DRAFT_873103 [Obelidium mucronatum]|nr:hypothetical protein BDR26DRAFT_873103 [Obelidium mucronatum]
MHSYDTGMGPAAKRNNWEQLQKACSKVGILLTRQMVEDVMRSKAEAGAMALSIVHHHVMKSGTSPMAVAPSATPQQNPSRVKQTPAGRTKSKLDSIQLQGNSQPQGEEDPKELGAEHQNTNNANNNLHNTQKSGSNTQSGIGGGGIIMNNSKVANQFLLGINATGIENPNDQKIYSLSGVTGSESATSFDEHMGKVAVLKVLCSMFGISDQQVSFGRSCFATLVCREKLIGKFDSISQEDLELLPRILESKEKEFSAILQHSPPSDIQLLFEVLLPCVINFAADTKVLHVATAIIAYFGFLLQAFPSSNSKDTSSRILQIKEFTLLLSRVSTNPEKIQFIARILNAVVGPDTPDAEKVRVVLHVKAAVYGGSNAGPTNRTSINMNGISGASGNSAFSTGYNDIGNPFIGLLCAVQLEASMRRNWRLQHIVSLSSKTLAAKKKETRDREMLSHQQIQSSQHVTLLLSECLTVINTHRKSAELGQLFASPASVMEVCAALHLLAYLAVEPNPKWNSDDLEKGIHFSTGAVGVLPDGVAGDIIGQDRGFLRAVMYQNCPPCLQKAYIAFLSSVLKNIGDTHCLAPLARNAAGCLLKSVKDDVLRASIILFSPCLENHLPLCTPYTQGLSQLKDSVRSMLLEIPEIDDSSWSTSKSIDLLTTASRLVIQWDLPFVTKQVLPRVVDTWFPFGIAMGVVRMMQTSKNDLIPREYLQILLAVSVSISISPTLYAPAKNRPTLVVAPTARPATSDASSPSLFPGSTTAPIELMRPPTSAAAVKPSFINKSKDPWIHIFLSLSDAIFASLTQEETSQFGVNIIESFLRTRGHELSENLKGLMASIVYLHIAGHRRPRERLMRLVTRWASFLPEKVGEGSHGSGGINSGWNTSSENGFDCGGSGGNKATGGLAHTLNGKEENVLVDVTEENQIFTQRFPALSSGNGGVVQQTQG